ncbi:MAG: helix-turn-helix domain-containing protein [Pseudomonadota bacterium]
MSSKLKEAREEAGYTVEEVAEKLNIRKQYIICLEEGNFEGIPGKVYVEGYTKMYSEFLGIEAPNKAVKNAMQTSEVTVNSKQKVKRKYVVFLSAMMLILVILIYSMIKSSKVEVVEVVEDELIKNIQEQNGNKEEEFN